MNDCCNANGECKNGHGCPSGPASVAPSRALPRSCHALGICQNPHHECAGECQQTPVLEGALTEPQGLWPVLAYWLPTVALGAISLFALAVSTVYLWQRWFA